MPFKINPDCHQLPAEFHRQEWVRRWPGPSSLDRKIKEEFPIADERKNKLRKSLGCFAQFSPFNSFRINKSISESSKMCTELPLFYAPQPFWNQHAVSPFRTRASSLRNSLMSWIFHPKSTTQGSRQASLEPPVSRPAVVRASSPAHPGSFAISLHAVHRPCPPTNHHPSPIPARTRLMADG